MQNLVKDDVGHQVRVDRKQPAAGGGFLPPLKGTLEAVDDDGCRVQTASGPVSLPWDQVLNIARTDP